MSLHTCGTIRQLFKIINSQHPIILANIQTISPLTALIRVGQFFKIYILTSLRHYAAITQALLPVHLRYVIMTIQAYAAHEAGGKLEPFEYELSSLKPDGVEIDLEYCGICHSDLSMLKNDCGFTRYPFVPGHEAIGRVAAIGNMVNHLSVGQYVGLG